MENIHIDILGNCVFKSAHLTHINLDGNGYMIRQPEYISPECL